jgi:hypothetical protein
MFKKLRYALAETLVSYKKIDRLHARELNDYKHPKMNLGQLQASLNNQKQTISNLSEVEFQVFSQYGDDGIIQYLISRLPIQHKTFIEFGVENYREANTRFLLMSNYWSGFVIDGSEANIQSIRNEDFYGYYDLRAEQCFITKDNINELLQKPGFDPAIGLLSIDIDGNDYWVWKAIEAVQPDIIICEYNALFGFTDPVTILYEPAFVRGGHRPKSYYGISLASACMLARDRGYFFIGSNSAGNNAYFIHEKHRSHCPVAETTPEAGYRFCVFGEQRGGDGQPLRGVDKVRALDGVSLIRTDSGETVSFNAAAVIESLHQHKKWNGIYCP